jgi:hypothetical protein
MKNESLIASSLYGTWTFVTETMTDVGYYKGRAYVVMHLMPDPMQIYSCQREDCPERYNKICQLQQQQQQQQKDSNIVRDENDDGDAMSDKEECIDTETSVATWSDGMYAVLFFGCCCCSLYVELMIFPPFLLNIICFIDNKSLDFFNLDSNYVPVLHLNRIHMSIHLIG